MAMDMARQLHKAVFTGPGRDLGMLLGFRFKEAATTVELGIVVAWDWDERQDMVEIEDIETEEVAQEVERQNADVEPNVELSRQDSRNEVMRERRDSNLGLQEVSG